MQLGMVGLGRMGGSMTIRLMAGGHSVIAYARDPVGVKECVAGGAIGAEVGEVDATTLVTASPVHDQSQV